MDDFDFDDKKLDEIGKITDNKIIQGAFEGIINLDSAKLMVSGKARIDKIERGLIKRREKYEKLM